MRSYFMTASDVKSEYFNWLYELTGFGKMEEDYYILCKDLYNREFTYSIEMDKNRALDGEELREDFMNEHPYIRYDYISALEKPCSVLEMLIALAKRMDYEVEELDEVGNHISEFFLEMISNLGLMMYNDKDYYDNDGTFEVDVKVSRFLNRLYFPNGDGGIFPLRHTPGDQRNSEIWYQMGAYLDENYPL